MADRLQPATATRIAIRRMEVTKIFAPRRI
jgi:hypothetical protein